MRLRALPNASLPDTVTPVVPEASWMPASELWSTVLPLTEPPDTLASLIPGV
jgi:hypothetical protein